MPYYKIKMKEKRNPLFCRPSFLSLTSITLIFFLGCSGPLPESIGQLAPCPEKPNCVSSKSPSSFHKIAPLAYRGPQQAAREKLIEIIKSMPRTRIVVAKDDFIHVEFTSKLFRFVDDVEFYFEEPRTVHFRSASRLGHSDLGVNRERMETIHNLFRK
ncbi:MAG: DUF1499 domain-containing protein [Nitrospinota bacterium]|nr:DUF1499 domain-containing protein [Nitrospinota bacterium]